MFTGWNGPANNGGLPVLPGRQRFFAGTAAPALACFAAFGLVFAGALRLVAGLEAETADFFVLNAWAQFAAYFFVAPLCETDTV